MLHRLTYRLSQFSEDDSFLYLTAADNARVKVFVLPIPATPSSSTKHPSLPPHYTHPRPLTSSGAAGGLQILKGGRLLYTLSSITSPNDVYVVRGLKDLEKELSEVKGDLTLTWKSDPEQITKFTEEDLKGKDIIAPEEFTFEGAEGVTVQGWAIRPKGWKEGEKKKWPVVLLIHGGPQGAWDDQWSTRWNPEVFAQQGYFTVAINPSTVTVLLPASLHLSDFISCSWFYFVRARLHGRYYRKLGRQTIRRSAEGVEVCYKQVSRD